MAESRLKVLVERLEAPEPALTAAGTLLAARARAAFDKQRRGTVRWAPRQVPSVAGILADLAAGRPPHPARFDPRPALVVTGSLRSSIRFVVLGKRLRLSADVPYARLHEKGGTSKQKITRTALRGLYELLKSRRDLGPRLGFLFTYARQGRALETRVPARPFLVPTATDMKDARAAVARYITSR